MGRIAVLVIGYGHEKLPNVSDDTAGEAGPSCIDLVHEHHVPARMKVLSLDTSASNTGTCLPSILAPYAYEVFLPKICQSSIGHTLGPGVRIFKISSISPTDIIIITAINSFGSISPGSQELNCPCREEISGFWSAAI